MFVEGVWIGSAYGVLLRYCSCLLITISISRLHFDMCYLILEKLY